MEKSYPFTLLPRYPGAREYPYWNVALFEIGTQFFTTFVGLHFSIKLFINLRTLEFDGNALFSTTEYDIIVLMYQ